MSKVALSRTSVRGAALLLLVVAVLVSPLGVLVHRLHAGVDKNVPTSAPDIESDKVSAIAAEFRVDESGAATYSIPIYTVPGTAGVVPQLSLNYSSQGGYGPVGKGWSIGGTSAITRCRATREAGDFITDGIPHDGTLFPINFTSEDRFCLDGQRLVQRPQGQPGDGCPAISGFKTVIYATEIESFQRVCAYNYMPAVGVHSPWFFTVERKDGSISWYGDRDNYDSENRPDGYVETNAPGFTREAFIWAQTRFQDSTGNYIDYLYHENPVDPTVSVEHLLAEVRFTGKRVLPGQSGAAQAPYAKVMFNYSMRSEPLRARGFASGGIFVQRWRLENVMSCDTITSGQCAPNRQARYYELGYGTSASASNFQIVNQILECRDSSKAVCAKPTTFAWSTGQHAFATAEYIQDLPTGSLSKYRGHKMGDIDGDGRLDIVVLKDEVCSTEGLTVFFSNLTSAATNNVATYSEGYPICTPSELGAHGEGSWHLFDYNGDGMDDLFVRGAARWMVYLSQGRTGTHNFSTANYIPNVFIPALGNGDDQVQLADFNGDGLMDIVYPASGELRIRMMERQPDGSFGWGAQRDVGYDLINLPYPAECSNPMTMCWRTVSPTPSDKTGFSQLADLNGDAASDLLITVTTTVRTEESGNCIPQGTDPTMDFFPLRDKTSDRSAIRLAFRPKSRKALAGPQGPIGPCRIFVSEHPELHAFTTKSLTGGLLTLRSMGMIAHSDPEAIALGDVNADGLTDVFVRNAANSDWYPVVNTGTGFLAGATLPLGDFRKQVQFADVNGDGRTDVLHIVGTGGYRVYNVRYAQPAGGFAASVALPGGNARACDSSNCDPESTSSMFTDLDADGNMDYFRFHYKNNIAIYASRSAARFAPRDVIVEFKNGFDARTTLQYAPLTNGAVHRRDFNSRNSQNWGRGSPVTDPLMPMYVVASASSSAPRAGNPAAMATVHYRYAGAKFQAGGRGFLGFREIVTYDPNQAPNQHVSTRTIYSQRFPFVGMPVSTVKRVAASAYVVPACLSGGVLNTSCFPGPNDPFAEPAGALLSDSEHTWESDTDVRDTASGFSGGAPGPVHVRTLSTNERVYDLTTTALTSRVSTAFAYGAFGNVTLTDVQTFDGAGTLLYTVTTSNQYKQDNVEKWRLGRLNFSTVTHARPGVSSVVRRVAFNYAMGGAATGLLDAERTGIATLHNGNHSGPADQNLLKTYALDAYGNRTMVRMCANTTGLPTGAECNSTLTQFRPANARTVHRYTRTIYDSGAAGGRYPIETWEPFWNGTGAIERKTSTIHARNIFGDATHVSDVNGIQTRALSGTLGRPYYTWQQTTSTGTESEVATGVRSLTRYRWCGTGSNEVTCPAGAKFRKETLITEMPGQWSYHDLLGRELLKIVENFNVGTNQRYTAVCTQYDAVGRVQRVSNPFFLWSSDYTNSCTGTTLAWSTTTYDVLGRPTSVATPDEAGAGNIVTTTMAYSGLSTTVTDPRNNTTTKLNWATGELRRVTDAVGMHMHYSYYADGTVRDIVRDAGRGAVRNGFVYDSLGRKIQQDDPDSGQTTLEYNALGELVAQVDANGNRTETWYDARGRVWRTTSKRPGGSTESESTFTFDTAVNGTGQIASETITGTYSDWIGQTGTSHAYSRTFTYDSFGRPTGTSTSIDGTAYTTASAYDARGRAWKSQDVSGKWLKTQFTTTGAMKSLCESSAADAVATCPNNASTYLTLLEADARGNILRQRRGNSTAMETLSEYWDLSGRIAGICTGNASCSLMYESYGWDAVGNLHTQIKESRYEEHFTYDTLNRLSSGKLAKLNGVTVNLPTLSFGYDALGNVCEKRLKDGTLQQYSYLGRSGCGVSNGMNSVAGGGTSSVVGPHQVGEVGGNQFQYDLSGNQTRRLAATSSNDRFVRFSAEGLAYEVDIASQTSPTYRARFWYGPDGQRYKAVHVDQGRTILYLGNVEVYKVGASTTFRRNVGGVLQQDIVGAAVTNHYLWHDHLGSLVRITNASGIVQSTQDFVAQGERRNPTDPTNPSAGGAPNNVTFRGFTGHEQFGRLGIVHMNARLYDETLGRFLSADPMVQSPENLQSWNAYTYVFNNPLAYTDPTGMFSWPHERAKRIGRSVIRAIGPEASGLVASVGCGFTGPFYALCLGAANYEIARAHGASSSDALKGGVIAAFSAYVGGAIGDNIVGQAVVGGITAELQGGSFGSGFVSAGLTAAIMPQLGGITNDYGRAATGAIVGGTISVATGGKFANGAISGALQAAMVGAARDSEELVTGSGTKSKRDDVLLPETVKVEESGFATHSDAALAAGKKYGPTGVANRQEPQVGIGLQSDGTWAYYTPGWGPKGAVLVDSVKLLAMYKGAGLPVNTWLHGHFDSNLNFSATDFALVWGRNGSSGSSYMVNRNGEVRVLTNAYLQKMSRGLPLGYRGLSGVQKYYSQDGLPGEGL